MPRALGSHRALRITSWSPSILLQLLAANDVGCRYTRAAQDREGDARHFIGESDGDKLEGLGLHEFLREGSQRVLVRLAMIEDRMRAHDEQFPQISIAQFRDAAQPLLAAGRVLSWRQAKKGGELARA